MATCPRPTCQGLVIGNKCIKCGAFTYGSVSKNAAQRAPVQGTGFYVPPKIMKAYQWKNLTSMRFRRRSKTLRDLDLALRTFELNPSQAKFGKLRFAFAKWLDTKGGMKGSWMKSRNDYNYKQGVTKLAKQLNGESVPLARDFMKGNLDHARRGILYFFSNLEFQFNDYKLILDMPLEVASNVSTLGLLDKYLVGENNPALVPAGKAIDAASDYGNSVVQPVFGEANDRLSDGLKEMQDTDLSPRSKKKSSSKSKTNLRSKLMIMLKAFVEGLFSKLKSMFKISWKSTEAWANMIVTATKNVANVVLKILEESLERTLVPFLGEGMDILGGVAKMFKGIRELVVDYWQGRNVTLMSGHPTAIRNALQGYMSRSLFEGFYKAIKGGVDLGVKILASTLSPVGTAVVGVAQSIGKVVLSCLELTAKIVYRTVEGIYLKRFINEAEVYYKKGGTDPIAIYRDHERFNDWFRPFAFCIPVIAALTINGEVCGDLLTFLQVVNDDDSIIDDSQYKAGCTYINKMKDDGKQLVDDSGWRFHSRSPTIRGALTRMKNRPVNGSMGSALMNVVDNALGA